MICSMGAQMQLAISVKDFANAGQLPWSYALALMEPYIQTPIRLAKTS